MIKDNINRPNNIFDLALIYVLFSFSIIGSSYIGINIGGVVLSPFRFFLILSIPYFFTRKYPFVFSDNIYNYVLFYIIWIIWGIGSILWAKDTNRAAASIYFLVVALWSICICTQSLNDIKSLHIVIIAVSILFIFSTYIGLYEYQTGNYLFVNKDLLIERMSIEKYRAPLVFFTNQNDFSLFVYCGTLFTFYLFSISSNYVVRFLLLITCVIAVFLIIISKSRGPSLALIVAAIYWFFIFAKNRIRLCFFLSFVLLSYILYLYLFDVSYFDPINTFKEFFHIGYEPVDSYSDSNRLILLKDGIDMAISSYGFGVGLSNSVYYLQNVYRNSGGIYALHSWPIQVFAESGVIIGFLYVFQFIWLYLKTRIIYIQSDNLNEKKAATLFLILIVSLPFGLVSPSSVFDIEWVWMLLALLISFVNQSETNNNQTVCIESPVLS